MNNEITIHTRLPPRSNTCVREKIRGFIDSCHQLIKWDSTQAGKAMHASLFQPEKLSTKGFRTQMETYSGLVLELQIFQKG